MTFTSSPDGLRVRVQDRGYIDVSCSERSRCDDGDESEEGESKGRERGHHGGLGGIGGGERGMVLMAERRGGTYVSSAEG